MGCMPSWRAAWRIVHEHSFIFYVICGKLQSLLVLVCTYCRMRPIPLVSSHFSLRLGILIKDKYFIGVDTLLWRNTVL